MKDKKELYLFTGLFPYGKLENFLETEIDYLCKEFDDVYVVPFRKEGYIRSYPSNCIVLSPIAQNSIQYLFHGLYCNQSFNILIKDFFTNRVFCSLRKLKVWLTGYIAVNCILNSFVVKSFKDADVVDKIFYFYWGKWGNVLSLFIKDRVLFVSRFHGDWDLWEEKYDNYAPLRKYVAEKLDAAIFISQKGQEYFNKKYPNCPTSLHRLGTKDLGICKKSDDGILRVVSCSSVYPLKRVDLILKAVINVANSQKVEWTHLGGGVDFDKIQKMALSNQNPNLSINLLGQMTYTEVQNYYKNNVVDVFINLSTSEGIPVSIMEAISCDIPVVATDVGGTSEIVNKQTGILISKDSSIEEISNAILELNTHHCLYSPRKFWERNFSAEKNYSAFAQYLKSLSKIR